MPGSTEFQTPKVVKRALSSRSSGSEGSSGRLQTPKIKKLKMEMNKSTTPGTPGQSPAFEIPPSPCLKQLGFGTGVKVLLYERSPRSSGPRSPWAIKKLNKKNVGEVVKTRLEKEAAILKGIDHPNIIGYRGFKRSEDGSRVLALETKKSIRSLFDMNEETRESLEEEGEEELDCPAYSADEMAFVVKEVAKALHYLHKEKNLLHGDLKAANVLIEGDFDAVKLCDFGVSVPLDKDGNLADPNVQYVGTEPWCGPEVMAEEPISSKTDIWALGCIIFEMFTLDTPHSDKLPGIDDVVEQDPDESYDDTEYQEAMGTRPALPDNLELDESYEKLLSIFYACTMGEPEERPSAQKIISLLE